MSVRPQDLPDYVRPPVNEVVISASFAKLRLSQVHIGLFWSAIRDRYVSQQDTMPIEAAVEWFDVPVEVPAVDLSMMPLRRSWFIDKEPQWLLQIQEDRLIHNWRRVAPEDTYPRFEECLSRFMNTWRAFSKFCDTENLGSPGSGQLEVTYINHIDEQGGWNGLGEVANVLPDLSWRQGKRALPTPDALAWQTSFRLPFDFARLHISVKNAFRNSDRSRVLLCQLTVRGMPAENASMEDWLLSARAWCVRAFSDITSSQIQREVWGVK